MLRITYSILMYLSVPWLLLTLIHRGFRAPAYWRRWKERFGLADLPVLTASTWVHAVSVGEVQAALPLIEHLLGKENAGPVVVTTMTPTGSARVRALLADRVTHVYAPYDLPHAVHRFLNRINPVQAIIMETEIWPNMIAWCSRQGVPLILANARLSERSARGYRRIPCLGKQVLHHITRIAAQSEADKQRFIHIGAQPQQITVTGNIKMDLRLPPDLPQQAATLRRRLGTGRHIWIAASTHEGEETYLLQALQQVRTTLPDVLLVLVPRHPERAAAVAGLCKQRGYRVVLHSNYRDDDISDIYLVDTIGELLSFYAAADLAFMGGSLVPVGGHNMIEPCALGVAVIFGPHLFNFQQTSDQLVQAGAATRVDNTADLAAAVTALLSDAGLRQTRGNQGQACIRANRGALQHLIALIEST